MQNLYINDGFGELVQVTENKLAALHALRQEFETGYDAGCYLDDLDPINKWDIQEELENWAIHIPKWSIGTFFESHGI